MKNAYIIIILFLISNNNYGQILLCKSEDKIRHEELANKVFTEGFTKEGHIRWISFSDNQYTNTYFFNSQYLSQFCSLTPKTDELLISALELLNQKWIKTKENEWQKYTNDDLITVNLVFPENNEKPFLLAGSKKCMNQ